MYNKIYLFLTKLILIILIIIIYTQFTKEKCKNKFENLLINKNRFLNSLDKSILIFFILNLILHIIISIY